jgi:hypothetical protein
VPSRGGDLDPGEVPKLALARGLWAISPLDSLRGDIRRLTLRRQDAYVRAQAHRRRGQLVPASLCEELAENGSQLRFALDRYTEATGAQAD